MTGTWLTGWATGDIVTAAEFRKGAGSIFDVTLGAAAGQIDIPSIPQSYAHLLITAYARGDTAANNTPLYLRLNGDSSANYDLQLLAASQNTATSSEAYAYPAFYTGLIPAASGAAGLFGGVQIFIPHYAGNVNSKTALCIGSAKWGTASGNMQAFINACGWRSAAAINRLTFLASVGNLVAGTRVTIHALGA
jgi:hypothetical protein